MILIRRRNNQARPTEDHWEQFHLQAANMGVPPSMLLAAKPHVITDPKQINPEFITAAKEQHIQDVAWGINKMLEARNDWDTFLELTRITYYITVFGRR